MKCIAVLWHGNLINTRGVVLTLTDCQTGLRALKWSYWRFFAKSFNAYFLGGAKDLFGCMDVWGLNPEWLRRLQRTRRATNRETARKIMAVCCGKLAGDVNTGRSHKPGGVCTDTSRVAVTYKYWLANFNGNSLHTKCRGKCSEQVLLVKRKTRCIGFRDN